jgi:hypothetical protein
MSYQESYALRYEQSWLSQRTEVSVIKSADYIMIEDPNTPDHVNRLAWANWAHRNSSVAVVPFMWPVALDPTILSLGQDITDDQIDAIVSAALPQVLADFVANPPLGAGI